MISKIINHAASLKELASNPKSFSNCPDLHGGVPLEENGVGVKSRHLTLAHSARAQSNQLSVKDC